MKKDSLMMMVILFHQDTSRRPDITITYSLASLTDTSRSPPSLPDCSSSWTCPVSSTKTSNDTATLIVQSLPDATTTVAGDDRCIHVLIKVQWSGIFVGAGYTISTIYYKGPVSHTFWSLTQGDNVLVNQWSAFLNVAVLILLIFHIIQLCHCWFQGSFGFLR